jgi:hypothetical protein
MKEIIKGFFQLAFKNLNRHLEKKVIWKVDAFSITAST